MNSELSFLIVDDDPVDAKAVSRILSRAGISQKTDSASSMVQAKEKVRRNHYDAVILDLGLPDSQGIDGVIEFQATAPELPIVVLTGCEDESMALRSMHIGAEDFITKTSMTGDSLCRSLRYAIERHRRKSEAYKDIDTLRLSLGDAMRQASTDVLTGLPNRRALQQYLSQLESSRPKNPVIVALADLDHFKAINDVLGHQMGDSVLKEFAARLQHCLRASDFAARVGGDEFVIVFGELSHASAEELGKRIVEHVSSRPVHESGKDVPVTATLAMAELELPYVDLEQILLQTHDMLAKAKTEGRNQVQCAWGELPEGAKEVPAPLPQEGASEELFSENKLVQHVRLIRALGLEGSTGHHVLFGLGSESWPMAAPAISRARLTNRLGEMTLSCMKRAQEWRRREAPGSELHLDIEADAIKPWVCTALNRIFPSEAERANCVLFVHTDFPNQPGAGSLSDLRLLTQAGFQVGVRNIGDGSTILEHLQLLTPAWIRFDPALTLNVGRFERKLDALRQTVEMLRPLNARLLADECELEKDLQQLHELGFHAYYSKIPAWTAATR